MSIWGRLIELDKKHEKKERHPEVMGNQIPQILIPHLDNGLNC